MPSNSSQNIFSFFNHLTIKFQLMIILSPLFFVALYFVGTVLFSEYQHLIPDLIHFTKIALMAIGLTALMTPGFGYCAKKLNVVDPSVKKKNPQSSPIPLLGGTAIYVSFMLVLALFQPWPKEMAAIAIAGTIIFVVGTIDDVIRLPSVVRLAAQVLAILIVLSSGLLISFVPPTSLFGSFVTYLITIIWIIGITNALNFLDGADGLAAGISAIASFFFFLITLHLGKLEVSLVAAVLCGCCIGFLFHNFKPAKIYLGDGGSTFLGFILACIALYGDWSEKGHIVALGIPVLILGVLIFDMIYITISRVKNGKVRNLREWLDYVGHDHFHHRLIHLGFREEHAVLFIYIICAILGFSALVLEKSQLAYHVVILSFQACLLFASITILMLVGRNNQNR